MIAARQIFLGRGGGAQLPYDAEVEYLESSGGQYIDTGMTPSDDLATYITFSFTQISANMSPFGSRGSAGANDRYWVNYDNHFEIGYGYWAATSVTTIAGTKNTIAFNEIVDGSHTFTFNGTPYTSSGTPNTLVNIILFGRMTGNGLPQMCRMRLFDISMKRNGILVFDAIPVRVGSGSDAVGCLYDRVSGQLFRNAGTGVFVIGPDRS